MKLHQLVYYSKNQAASDDRGHLAQLREIIAVSQRNNQRDAITGYLIFDKVWFLQILEGERDKIFTTYKRIEKDPRHGTITLVQTKEIAGRAFPNWTMGGAMRTPEAQEVYLRHGIGGAIDPTKLKGQTIIELALDLQAYEAARKAGQRLAS
ncbi:MAG TPA: BLUF domain-containing protein [Beijerinckiaceae bacterium]|jgi:hypothetical protein